MRLSEDDDHVLPGSVGSRMCVEDRVGCKQSAEQIGIERFGADQTDVRNKVAHFGFYYQTLTKLGDTPIFRTGVTIFAGEKVHVSCKRIH
jgi:hypothetical protein